MVKKPSKKSAKKGAIKGATKGVAPTRLLKKRDHSKFSIFIYAVLQEVHPGTGMSKKAMGIVNELIHDVFDRIAFEAGKLCKYNGRSTMTSREIQTAVRLVLPGELAKHAVSEGTKYITRFCRMFTKEQHEKWRPDLWKTYNGRNFFNALREEGVGTYEELAEARKDEKYLF